MDPRAAYQIIVRAALSEHSEEKMALLNAAVIIGRQLGFAEEAELVQTIAANLRQADSTEQTLLELLEGGK